MFDDLRKEGDNSPFFQQEEIEPLLDAPAKKKSAAAKARKSGKFLGMTAFQRFFIATLFMIMIVFLGVAVLLLTNKIALPI
jgi:hypothetical protein